MMDDLSKVEKNQSEGESEEGRRGQVRRRRVEQRLRGVQIKKVMEKSL